MSATRNVKSVSCSFGEPEFHSNCAKSMIHCDCHCHIEYVEKEYSVATYRETVRQFVVEAWEMSRKPNYVQNNIDEITGVYSAITQKCTGVPASISDALLFLNVVEETCSHADYSMFRYEDTVNAHFGSLIPSTLEVFNK